VRRVIIVRSPLRITLGGGGTDLPSYYRDHGGFVLSAALDKYIYITLHRTFQRELIVKYSDMERVQSAVELRHPIVREAFSMLGLEGSYLEITSMADIPAGTGLGSSGSFSTALLRALHTLRKDIVHPQQLAEEACCIEIERLGDPVGKQDQYIASYGGIVSLTLAQDGKVEVAPLMLSDETLHNLEDNLVLFFTGFSRSASAVLADQHKRSQAGDSTMLGNLHRVKERGVRTKAALEGGDLREFARLMHEHWMEKRGRSAGMSNDQIDGWYDLAMANGALGGKVVGAGGGGFLLFYAEDKRRLRHAMLGAGLREVVFRFDFEGTKVVLSG
jgi:D-glycero-alpha-D-manno-heptose-7-phosphate kinase